MKLKKFWSVGGGGVRRVRSSPKFATGITKLSDYSEEIGKAILK